MTFTISDEILDELIGDAKTQGDLFGEGGLIKELSKRLMERGFRFLKSLDFLTSSFFLKKPERIEALLMVMTTCLMIYASVEYQI